MNITEKSNLTIWEQTDRIKIRFDARPTLAAGGHPVGEVLGLIGSLKAGEVMEFTTPFLPEPLIVKVKDAGLEVFTREVDGLFVSYFVK